MTEHAMSAEVPCKVCGGIIRALGTAMVHPRMPGVPPRVDLNVTSFDSDHVEGCRIDQQCRQWESMRAPGAPRDR